MVDYHHSAAPRVIINHVGILIINVGMLLRPIALKNHVIVILTLALGLELELAIGLALELILGLRLVCFFLQVY